MKSGIKRILVALAVIIICLPAAGTPYKNVWVKLDVATSGAGTVYITSADPKPKVPSVKGSQTELKATLTERDNGYPVSLHAVATAGWKFYAFTNVLKADNDYTNEDIVSRDNPATVLVTVSRTTETYVAVDATASEVEQKRDEAREKEPWPDSPDAQYYAVFVSDDGELITTLTAYAPFQTPDGSGVMGRIVRPEIVHEGDEVSIEAVPYPGFSFDHWSSQQVETFSQEPRIQVTAHADITYTAHFSVSPLVIGDEGWATYGSMKTVRVPSDQGLEAFVVNAVEDGKVYMQKTDVIPHETGVLLKAAPGSYLLEANTSEQDEPSLQSYLYAVPLEPIVTNGAFYILANKEQGVGFYLLRDGESVPVGKAFLRLNSEGNASSRTFLSLTDEASAITYHPTPITHHPTPITQHPTPITQHPTPITLSGQEVGVAYRGLVVKNGKKIWKR